MDGPLKPLRIGPIEIRLPVVLAALAGYSDLPFRLLCRRYGADYAATEMTLDTLLLHRSRHQSRLLARSVADHPVAGQLLGSDPAVMAEAARVMVSMGFDAVDLNFACPVNKALRRRRGGWLMREPGQIQRIVRAVVEAVDRPVTVKIRQKFARDDASETGLEVADRSFEAGAAALCCHARSVEAKYSGPADWSHLAELKRRFPDRTVIGSGDVLSPARALEMIAQTGVDAAYVARGALGNPWFFRQVRDLAAGRETAPPSLIEQRALLEEHFEAVCRLYDNRRGPKIFRKHAIKYSHLHPSPRELRIAMVEVKNARQMRETLDRFYPREPVGPPPERAKTP
jgi:nifR3 family TIM-barrel protein